MKQAEGAEGKGAEQRRVVLKETEEEGGEGGFCTEANEGGREPKRLDGGTF
jgi:hypothetical protein